MVAHECILDLLRGNHEGHQCHRRRCGENAWRTMASTRPTMSFPVAGTLMVEADREARV